MYTRDIYYPKLSNYWSYQPFFYDTFVFKLMPRNIFQELLKYFYVTDNDTIVQSNRLAKIPNKIKIKILILKLVNIFKKYKVPYENVYK